LLKKEGIKINSPLNSTMTALMLAKKEGRSKELCAGGAWDKGHGYLVLVLGDQTFG